MKNIKWLFFILILSVACSPSTSPNDSSDENGSDDPAEQEINPKKGFGIGTNDDNDWKRKIEELDISWHYSWGNRMPSDYPRGIEYVPMTWGAFANFDEAIDRIQTLIDQGRVKYVLGFNEPDASDQANMSVDRAIDAWPKLMELDVPLVSPAPVHVDGDWLKEFMERANEKDYRVDYIGMHWYRGPNPDRLIAELEEAYELYGLPIWLTEFGVADWNASTPDENRYSQEQVLEFMRDVLPRIDELDFVYRYAWFNSPIYHGPLTSSAIFDLNGELTTLGKYYKSR